jgi:hypothetical protein
MRLVVPATQMQAGDRLLNGKTVESRIAIDASQTPSLAARCKCQEFVAIRFVGEPLHVLFNELIKFAVDRPLRKESSK